MKRKYLSTWRRSLFTFTIALSMLATLVLLPSVFAKVGVNLDQFQNGQPPPAGASWNNGSINAQNSVYHEGESIPFRFFLTGLRGENGAETSHTFTIQWEYKKGGKPAYDYLTSFDRAPNGAYITTIGGPCSSVATAVPGDCVAPTVPANGSFPSPTLYPTSGPNGPPPFLSFAAERDLKCYNVASVSFGQYFFTGTASDPELNLPVTIQPSDKATGASYSIGCFWGGHLAIGTASQWGVNNGASSISGAPFHMRTKNLDGGGATNQDRSVQPGAVVPLEGCTLTNDNIEVCDGATTTHASTTTNETAASYSWSIENSGGSNAFLQNQDTDPSDGDIDTQVVASGAGSYTVTLTKTLNGQVETCSATVVVNPNLTGVDLSLNSACESSAYLQATVTGGTSPTYVWKKDDVVISGATSSSLALTGPGVYKVEVTDSKGCGTASDEVTICYGVQ